MGQRTCEGLPLSARRIGLACLAATALISLSGCQPQAIVETPPPPTFTYKIGSKATTCKDAAVPLSDHEPPIGGAEGSFQINFGNPTNLVNGNVSSCSHASSTTGSWLLYAAVWLTDGQAITSEKIDISNEVNSQVPIEFQLEAVDASGAAAGNSTVSLAQQTDPNAGTAWVVTTTATATLQKNALNPKSWAVKSLGNTPNTTVRLAAIKVGNTTIQMASKLGTKKGTWAYQICHPHETNLTVAQCGLTNPYINQVVALPFPRELLLKPELLKP